MAGVKRAGRARGRRRFDFEKIPKALQRRTTFLVERLASMLRERSLTALLRWGGASVSMLFCVVCRSCGHAGIHGFPSTWGSIARSWPRRCGELLARELLSVEVNDRDRRQDDVGLTRSGERLLALAEERLDQVEGELFGALVVDERLRLGELVMGAIARAAPREERSG